MPKPRIIERLINHEVLRSPHLIDCFIIVGGIAIVLFGENKTTGAFLACGGTLCLISK